jgi:hypothetical protein
MTRRLRRARGGDGDATRRALTVAPVVITSSTMAMRRPVRLRVTRNAAATLARRCTALPPVCEGVARRRSMPRNNTGLSSPRPSAHAISIAWW